MNPQPVYELTRQPFPAKTDLVHEILRRALSESEESFKQGASLRALGNMEAGARSYVKTIGKLEAAIQTALQVLERRVP